MTTCYRDDEPATHQLDRGNRGDPLPLCTPCADALADHDGDTANDLVSPIEGAS